MGSEKLEFHHFILFFHCLITEVLMTMHIYLDSQLEIQERKYSKFLLSLCRKYKFTVFTCKFCPQTSHMPVSHRRMWGSKMLPLAEQDGARDPGIADIHSSVGLDGMHPGGLNELADVIRRKQSSI